MLVCVPRTQKAQAAFLEPANNAVPLLFFIHYELFIFAQRNAKKKEEKAFPSL